MSDVTFTCPDLTTFCRLDQLGLGVVGHRVEPARATLMCRVVAADDWCRRCGCRGTPRDTVVRELAHEPFGWRPTTLLVRVRRYRCTGCGHVWRQDTSKAAAPRAKLSRSGLRWALVGIVCQHLTVARVAHKAFAPVDIVSAVAGIRGLGIRGAGVSMPYKEAVIPLIDELDPSATAIASVNTIVNTAGHLRGYNTDYIAVRAALTEHRVPTDLDFLVLGAGGMAKAILAALRDCGFRSGTLASRSVAAGQELATQYGYGFTSQADMRPAGLLVNATPIGMAGGPAEHDLSFDRSLVEAAQSVFDVVAFPSRTPLVALAEELGTPTISGAEIIALQAAEQFVLYTGIRPSPDQLQRAAAFSRAS